MATIGQHFENVSNEALRTVLRKRTPNDGTLALETLDICSALTMAFVWGESPEGQVFWESIYNQFKNGELSTINPNL